MNISEKAAYIKGLMEGLDLDCEKKEVKIIGAIVDLVEEMASEIGELGESYNELCNQLDEVDGDLAAVEDEVYGDVDLEDDEYDYEVECPNCGDKVLLSDLSITDGSTLKCPNCGEVLDLDFSLCEDDCDCGCHDGGSCDCHH